MSNILASQTTEMPPLPVQAAVDAADQPRFDVVVEAGRVEGRYWRDLFRYGELLWILAWRDVAVRYKQTAVGVLWVVGRPLLTVVVLTIVVILSWIFRQRDKLEY